MAAPIDLGALGFTSKRRPDPASLSPKELLSYARQCEQLFVVTDMQLDPTQYALDVRTPRHRDHADHCLACAKHLGSLLKPAKA